MDKPVGEDKENIETQDENNLDELAPQESPSPSPQELETYDNEFEAYSELELRQKLLDSKMARKRTEEDSKLLSNRIQLLLQEERKVKFLCNSKERTAYFSFLLILEKQELTIVLGPEKNRRDKKKSRGHFRIEKKTIRKSKSKRKRIFP